MRKHYVHVLTATLLSLTIGLAVGILVGIKRGVPFVAEKEQWTIGIYRGDSPFSFDPSQDRRNPVLTAQDVTDAPAKFVADPFLVNDSDKWYLFFELYNLDTEQGDLAVATSVNTRKWKYEKVVLDEPFHLSYPYVFKWQNDYYLIPETFEANSIRLYRSDLFPTKWSFVTTLVENEELVDPSIVQFNDKWWLFAAEPNNDTLRLYFANELFGPWLEHPESPIVEANEHIARPSGRVLIYEDRLYRYTMDVRPSQGTHQVWAFEITQLSTTSYSERPVSQDPILKPDGKGWNAQAMHQIDPHQVEDGHWIASVDGFGKYLVFGLQY